ncbi:MAG: FHA domain-containing protein [Bacteroidales bacterium]|nr:FHA domain-containing protein [Bacteroidales bacterium]
MGLQNYKRCSNGHYFKSDLSNCPYCGALGENVSDSQNTQNNSNQDEPTIDVNQNMDKTQMYGNGQTNTPLNADKTEVYGGSQNPPPPPINVNPDKTQIYNGGGGGSVPPSPNINTGGVNQQNDFEKTIITRSPNNVSGQQNTPQSSARRRLVGWLVSYQLDPYGISYSIYEGRNKIGRDVKNDITISDNTVSDIHVILLFRNDKYFLIDQGSSNGTYINGQEIDFQPVELNDNDIVTLGKNKAVFKFKSSL